jgi:MYXO-CTERM domain-containing protein
VDASSDISTCNGETSTGSGGTPSGLAPADFVAAYSIPSSPEGDGTIVAITDACANPHVLTDLAAYRANYGLGALPECGGADGHAPIAGGSPCIGVVSQRGGADLPTPDSEWELEIALDVEMVSAACPHCSILLVEADTPNAWDLGPAVNEAVALGASAVSNSYGSTEDPHDPFGTAYSDGPYAPYFEHPGVLIAVASGDDLYDDESSEGAAPSFPSTVPSVLSVGGTTLTAGGGATRGYAEVVWSGGGSGTTSGCSTEFAKPAYQAGLDAGSCSARVAADVAAVGDDVSVYNAGWGRASGTSCASPFVAALFARLGLAGKANDFFYANGSVFYDITSGNNDPKSVCTDPILCNAGVGWDGPSGLGTPNGALLLALVAPAVDGGMADAALEAGEAGEDDGSDATAMDATAASDASGDATLENDSAAPDDSGSGGGAAPGAGGNGAAGGSSGCSCTTAPSPRGGSSGLSLVALVALLLVRRATRARGLGKARHSLEGARPTPRSR